VLRAHRDSKFLKSLLYLLILVFVVLITGCGAAKSANQAGAGDGGDGGDELGPDLGDGQGSGDQIHTLSRSVLGERTFQIVLPDDEALCFISPAGRHSFVEELYISDKNAGLCDVSLVNDDGVRLFNSKVLVDPEIDSARACDVIQDDVIRFTRQRRYVHPDGWSAVEKITAATPLETEPNANGILTIQVIAEEGSPLTNCEQTLSFSTYPGRHGGLLPFPIEIWDLDRSPIVDFMDQREVEDFQSQMESVNGTWVFEAVYNPAHPDNTCRLSGGVADLVQAPVTGGFDLSYNGADQSCAYESLWGEVPGEFGQCRVLRKRFVLSQTIFPPDDCLFRMETALFFKPDGPEHMSGELVLRMNPRIPDECDGLIIPVGARQCALHFDVNMEEQAQLNGGQIDVGGHVFDANVQVWNGEREAGRLDGVRDLGLEINAVPAGRGHEVAFGPVAQLRDTLWRVSATLDRCRGCEEDDANHPVPDVNFDYHVSIDEHGACEVVNSRDAICAAIDDVVVTRRTYEPIFRCESKVVFDSQNLQLVEDDEMSGQMTWQSTFQEGCQGVGGEVIENTVCTCNYILDAQLQ
jgi:hypothetical protein